jgi:hypothetical protein
MFKHFATLTLSLATLTGCSHAERTPPTTTAPAGRVATAGDTGPATSVAGAPPSTRPAGKSGTLTRRKSEAKRAERNEFIDRLVLIDTAEAFNDGSMRRVRLDTADNAPRLVLNEPNNARYPRTGSWTSDETAARFPFTELIPSWNVTTPPQTGSRLYVRTRDAQTGDWSPWLYIGQWGRTAPTDERVTKFDGGRVSVDCLELDRPANAWQIRADLVSFDTNVEVNPAVRRLAVVYTGHVEDPAKRDELLGRTARATTAEDAAAAAPTRATTQPRAAWAVDLPVPFRPQGDNPKALRGQTCSPTSTTMLLEYWGVKKPMIDNCLAIWDSEYEMFGNWGRAVARAGEVGLDAWITRYRNWDEVRADVAAGQPVIASIRFARGEYSSFIYDGTAGHLLVVRGFTPEGDPICNDPASRAFGRGVVYKAADLGRAWFGNGGVAYVLKGTKPAGPPVPSKNPTTRQTDKKIVMGIDSDGLPE